MSNMQQTSLDAYESIRGTLNPSQQMVFHQLEVSGCCSNEKLSDLLSLPINKITPRILELRKKGLVKNMYLEKSKSGRKAKVWGIVHA